MSFFEVLFYSGEQMPPAYYLIHGIEGESPERALRDNSGDVVKRVRELFGLGDEIPDRKIFDALYVLRHGGLVPARTAL